MKNNRNKTVLVAGGNSGLGFDAATQLAESDHGKVILTCRTLKKAKIAKAALIRRVGKDVFDVLATDISKLDTVATACDELAQRSGAFPTGTYCDRKFRSRRTFLTKRARRPVGTLLFG